MLDFLRNISDQEIYLLLIAIVALMVGLLVVREFCCWYFKLNRMSNLLQEQNERLDMLIDLIGSGQEESGSWNLGNAKEDSSPEQNGSV